MSFRTRKNQPFTTITKDNAIYGDNIIFIKGGSTIIGDSWIHFNDLKIDLKKLIDDYISSQSRRIFNVRNGILFVLITINKNNEIEVVPSISLNQKVVGNVKTFKSLSNKLPLILVKLIQDGSNNLSGIKPITSEDIEIYKGYGNFKLIGPQGEMGPIGDTGSIGLPGFKGITGSIGEQGVKGHFGLTGSNGAIGDKGPIGSTAASIHRFVHESPADPIADFVGSPTILDQGLTVYFVNNSIGDWDSLLWDFGDGSTSTEDNPTHIYYDVGMFTVTLYLYGAIDSIKKIFNYITVTIPPSEERFLTALYEEMYTTKDATLLTPNLYFKDFVNNVLSGNGSWYGTSSYGLQLCLGGYIDGTNCIVTSLDGGLTWQTANDSGLFDYVNDIAWGNGVWVAVGSGVNSKAYSYDGINWTGLGVDNPLNECYCVKFNGTIFIAGGYPIISTDPTSQYSSDGITWNNSDLLGSLSFTNMSMVDWDGSKWVANTSYKNQDMAYSTNGINWTQYSPIGLGIAYPLSIAHGSPVSTAPIWILVGRQFTGGVNSIAYSYDAENWINLGTALELRLDKVAWDGNLFVAVSSDQSINSLVYSADGINWIGSGIILPYGGYTIAVVNTI